MAKRFFTKEELDNIIKDYDNGNGLRPFELAKKYDRNPSSISNKLKDLGLYKYTTYRFTEEDVQFLKDYYPRAVAQNRSQQVAADAPLPVPGAELRHAACHVDGGQQRAGGLGHDSGHGAAHNAETQPAN